MRASPQKRRALAAPSHNLKAAWHHKQGVAWCMSNQTPPFALSEQAPATVHMVLDDFGERGCAYRETDEGSADEASIVPQRRVSPSAAGGGAQHRRRLGRVIVRWNWQSRQRMALDKKLLSVRKRALPETSSSRSSASACRRAELSVKLGIRFFQSPAPRT